MLYGDDYAILLAQQPGNVAVVEYREDGYILSYGSMSYESYKDTLRYTKRKLLIGEGNPEGHYVDFSAGAPVLTLRPKLGAAFDKTSIAVREPATLKGLGPASVAFEGPVRGRHEHKGGDLVVGWTVPGTYTLRVNAFPYLPAEFVLTVGVAS